jgi:hypothetical protein
MELWLADDVHAVMIDHDAVFLDVATNAYYCLPEIGAVLTVEGRAITTAAEGLSEDLIASGLATITSPPGAPRRAQPPRRTARAVLDALAREGRARPTPAHWRGALNAGLSARADERRRFADRLPPASASPAPTADPALLADLDAFRQMAPWLPFDGACLFRSSFLRKYLTALGHQVDWVFGVRTWPFAAHCWLQAGDLALDDEAERLIAYHPIMVR